MDEKGVSGAASCVPHIFPPPADSKATGMTASSQNIITPPLIINVVTGGTLETDEGREGRGSLRP